MEHEARDEHQKQYQKDANAVVAILKKMATDTDPEENPALVELIDRLIEKLSDFTDTNKKLAQVLITTYDNVISLQLPVEVFDLLNKKSYPKVEVSKAFQMRKK